MVYLRGEPTRGVPTTERQGSRPGQQRGSRLPESASLTEHARGSRRLDGVFVDFIDRYTDELEPSQGAAGAHSTFEPEPRTEMRASTVSALWPHDRSQNLRKTRCKSICGLSSLPATVRRSEVRARRKSLRSAESRASAARRTRARLRSVRRKLDSSDELSLEGDALCCETLGKEPATPASWRNPDAGPACDVPTQRQDRDRPETPTLRPS